MSFAAWLRRAVEAAPRVKLGEFDRHLEYVEGRQLYRAELAGGERRAPGTCPATTDGAVASYTKSWSD